MIMKAESLLFLKRLFPESSELVRVFETEEENKNLAFALKPIPPPLTEITLKS